jgi:hypothetical protein
MRERLHGGEGEIRMKNREQALQWLMVISALMLR